MIMQRIKDTIILHYIYGWDYLFIWFGKRIIILFGTEILHGFNFLFLSKSYWQEAEVGVVFAVVGLLRGRWLFWSQYAPSGEWCFKANTQYTHTIAVITIAVINETLKAALQGHLLPSRLIKGLSLTSIKTEEKWGRGRYRERERMSLQRSCAVYLLNLFLVSFQYKILKIWY